MTAAAFVRLALVLTFAAGLLVLALPRYGRVDGWLWRWAYRRYLESATWRKLKAAVLYRDFYACKDCGILIAEWENAQPHHTPGTYRRWLWYAMAPLLGLRENPDDLITVCRDCHAEIHGQEE